MKDELDDWTPYLPPLDDDDEPGRDEVGDELDSGLDETTDALDDRASDHLPIDDDIDESPDEGALGDDEAGPLSDFDRDDEPIDDVDEPIGAIDGDATGLADSELDLIDEIPDGTPEREADDGGEDGTTEPIEDAIEGELPALDADEDENDSDDAWFGFEMETFLHLSERRGASHELAPWADVAWDSVRVPPAVAASTISALALPGERAVVAVGRDLYIVEAEPAVAHRLDGSSFVDGMITALAAYGEDADFLAATTAEGRLFVSSDRGRTFIERAGWGSPAGRHDARPSGAKIADLLFSEGEERGRPWLWVNTHRGELCRTRDLGRSWEMLAQGVVAIAVCAGLGVDALVMAGNRLERHAFRGGQPSPLVTPIAYGRGRMSWLGDAGRSPRVLLATANGGFAFAEEGQSVFMVADHGSSCDGVPRSAGARAMVFSNSFSGGDGAASWADGLLVALADEQANRLYIASIDRALSARIVAEIGNDSASGGSTAGAPTSQAVSDRQQASLDDDGALDDTASDDESDARAMALRLSRGNVALSWDAVHERLWVATAIGLFAFAARRAAPPS